MTSRLIFRGMIAALILAGAPLQASAQDSGGILGRIGLPGVFGKSEDKRKAAEPRVQLAQSGDPRITALEEQVRQLSGTIEELNFQILQMQEQMRQMQEDNEFRFQELEKGKGKTNRSVVKPADTTADASSATTLPGGVEDGTKLESPSLGTITVAPDGTVRSSTAVEPPLGGEPMDTHSDGTTVASLPPAGNAEELYRNSYEFILSGDYATAESGFRDHIDRFPQDARTADAHFWLGESLLGQQKYRDAAEVFLAANRDYPDSKKAPDMLFKLGVSLAGLNQRDIACATFGEVGKRYPNASDALKGRVKQEQAAAGC
ncbi:MAG: tol-pal system protein YbgF [Rhizobiaceae bacterium]|nr:tol-pal system protein YbgF [Rhizobiaceae bacterium]